MAKALSRRLNRALNRGMLFAITSLVLAAILLELGYYQQNQVYQCQYTIQQAQISLLTLRRHEKDYIARRQAEYKNQLFDRSGQLYQEVNLARHCTTDSAAQIEQITQLLNQYQEHFSATIRELDYRPQQELSELNLLMVKQKELENQAREFNIAFYAQLLGLRERLLNYVTEDNHQLLADIQNTLSRLQKWQGVPPELRQSVTDFSLQIQSIDDLMKEVRFAHEQGEMKAMRNSAHQIEEQLASLQAQLDHKLNQWQSSRWLSYGLVFIGLILLSRRHKANRP
ncbi:hypothetical protein [Motilimonas eburnea]|uniref:hypothetical protein n=1 Tax=Motilimonas eburnea TaxID=1737488 RepID=UPI001E2D3CE5|nr:hypothetical protein [Motilimonas eburnea]MCE2569882.1 hypothetical protein [Motilimonas eburnea]